MVWGKERTYLSSDWILMSRKVLMVFRAIDERIALEKRERYPGYLCEEN